LCRAFAGGLDFDHCGVGNARFSEMVVLLQLDESAHHGRHAPIKCHCISITHLPIENMSCGHMLNYEFLV
jgi:hypothetical protein